MAKKLPEDLKKLRALIAYVGSREALAAEIGIVPTTFSSWFTTTARIPAKHFHKLVKASNGIFTVTDFIRE